jgi:hypothetical protein
MNRNYLFYPAQTNLEFNIQLIESNYYEKGDIELINKAYYFCLNKVSNIYRGSGKPFLAHLVGTASILASQKTELSVVVAALMHALYQMRVPFPEARNLSERRDVVSGLFGTDIESLIFSYTEYENSTFDELKLQIEKNPFFYKVLLMRLADELEDLSYYAIFMHGKSGDGINEKGSFLWRKAKKTEEVVKILDLLSTLGINEYTAAFKYWVDTNNYPKFPEAIKSGYYSSFSI